MTDEVQDLFTSHSIIWIPPNYNLKTHIEATTNQIMLSSLLNNEAEDNLEVNSKAWRSRGYDYHEDDKISNLHHNLHCFPFSMVTCTKDGHKK